MSSRIDPAQTVRFGSSGFTDESTPRIATINGYSFLVVADPPNILLLSLA